MYAEVGSKGVVRVCVLEKWKEERVESVARDEETRRGSNEGMGRREEGESDLIATDSGWSRSRSRSQLGCGPALAVSLGWAGLDWTAGSLERRAIQDSSNEIQMQIADCRLITVDRLMRA